MAGRTPFGSAYVEPGVGRPDRFDLRTRVQSWSYEDNDNEADVLTLELDNDDLTLWDQVAVSTGNTIVFVYGFGEARSPERRFIIRDVTGGLKLRLECHGQEVLLDSEPRRSVYRDQTISEAVTTILLRAGFSTEQLVIEPTEARIVAQNQAGRTDAQFIARAARKLGWVHYWAADGTYHFEPRDVGQAPGVVLGFRTTAEGAHPINAPSVSNNITRRAGRVGAAGRDPDTKVNVEAEASNSTEPDRPVLAPYVGSFDPDTGALVTSGSTGPDVGSPYSAAVPAVGEAVTVAEAEEVAKGGFRGVVQRGVEMSATAPAGLVALEARIVVKVIGIGERLSGSYYVRKATHAGAGGSYSTSLELITEGFQRGRGGKGGGDPASLPGLWGTTSAAVTADPGADEALLSGVAAIAQAQVPGWEQDPAVVAVVGAQATQLAAIAASSAPEASAALASFAASCRNSKPGGSDETAGAVNEQDAAAGTGVTQAGRFDEETGELVVSFEPS